MALTSSESDNAARSALKRAIVLCHSQKRLADLCRVKQQTISKALQSGKVSIPLALYIHKATKGRVDRIVLCPELRRLL